MLSACQLKMGQKPFNSENHHCWISLLKSYVRLSVFSTQSFQMAGESGVQLIHVSKISWGLEKMNKEFVLTDHLAIYKSNILHCNICMVLLPVSHILNKYLSTSSI